MTVLTIRNVEIEGRPGLDVRIEDGRVAAVGSRLPRGGEEIDGRGGALISGLCDHHIHIFGLAARADSVDVTDAATPAAFAVRIAAAAATRPQGAWLRAFGYHEAAAGELTRHDLDRIAPRHRLRVQHRTGALWVLNSLALTDLPADDDPPGLEREAGRLWRGDAWLRARLGTRPPPLAPIGARLAGYGITALTDASVTTDAGGAALLAQAHRAGDLPQRLLLMSGGELTAPGDGAFAVGPRKVLLDDHALIGLDDFTGRIDEARTWGRPVAVHCVTAGELALTLAAFETAGARPGDRVEHGGVIPRDAIAQLRALGLTVVTQPAFIHDRGDRYLSEVDPVDQPDLYRCASLRAAGVPVAASSDAPYAGADPWLGIAAAVRRRSAGGRVVGASEAVDPATALAMYLGDASDPGGPARRVAAGAVADLVLLNVLLDEALADPSAERVRLTIIGGEVAHGR